MPVQAVFAVSKRSFKSAVKRNRMRRLMKESYRLHKSGLYKCLTSNNKSLLLALIYLGSELPEYNETEAKIILILRRLTEENENAAR